MSYPTPTSPSHQRLKIVIRGAVQGVGFRPFIYRLAQEFSLPGWVNNSAQGVFIEVEGPREQLEAFLLRIEKEKPPRSFIQSLEASFLDAIGYTTFEIRHSEESGAKSVLILPDLATCPDCLSDIRDPHNRRYLYPFTNCTNCGPRFSIIEALPYDRPHTSMKHFPMCAACQSEYENPLDRRFHAQPNACPQCGPQLELWDGSGAVLAARHDALLQAAQAIRDEKIVAVKGLGGFHLICAAHSDAAVKTLRQRKHREEKPFAVMCPNLASAKALCEIAPLEERLLLSPEAPIVLLRKHSSLVTRHSSLAAAPDNPFLGVMLPYTPLHHILLGELGFPVVATSGNLSDEPICTDEREALQRLGALADVFLVHNRPIVRHVDDSIACLLLGRELVLRRARGYAPLPIHLKHDAPPILAVGAHLKNAVALSVGGNVFISQHIGDLETAPSLNAFRRVIDDFQRLYEVAPQAIACDLHPDYASTRHAHASGLPVQQIQHHVAHVFSCMAENELDAPLLGVSWDGTGYGPDGTIWGGEFFSVGRMQDAGCGIGDVGYEMCDVGCGIGDVGYEIGDTPTSLITQRFAHLRPFPLPGGEKAVREPRRVALGLLYEIYGDEVFSQGDLAPLRAFSANELNVLRGMLNKNLNTPRTSSMGRLFDAVASLCDLKQTLRFEGQAAMQLEFAAADFPTEDSYDFTLDGTAAPFVINPAPMIEQIIEDVNRHAPTGEIAARFHNTLAEIIVAIARRAGHGRVALSGGCFQNRNLTERTVQRLQATNFRPYWHQRVPPNDGGIALGQIFAGY